jgi:methylmalonyl-CoA mutase N-terminal domain/subunit
VLGGCQSLHANGWTKPWRCPPKLPRCWPCAPSRSSPTKPAWCNTADPAAGSYVIEKLTDEIEAGARNISERIDAMGGMIRAIETRLRAGEIQKAAFEYQQAVERGEQVVVGVNRFTVEDEKPIPTMRVDPQIESAQVARVQAVRARRDAAKVPGRIAEVERRARVVKI